MKKVATRFDLAYRIDDAQVAAEASGDGIFPLVTNVSDLPDLALLHAYKRQPAIEKAVLATQDRLPGDSGSTSRQSTASKPCCASTSSRCWWRPSWSVSCVGPCNGTRSTPCPCTPEGRACRWPTARRGDGKVSSPCSVTP